MALFALGVHDFKRKFEKKGKKNESDACGDVFGGKKSEFEPNLGQKRIREAPHSYVLLRRSQPNYERENVNEDVVIFLIDWLNVGG